MYKPYFQEKDNDFGFTSTFEFFIHNGKLMCEYNASTPKTLVKFLNRSYYPEIRPLFQKIAKHIITKYGHFDTVKYWVKSKMKWEEILVEFIVKYFSKYDSKLDIIIKANGDVVFNLEEHIFKKNLTNIL
jgi:hypothetical protein